MKTENRFYVYIHRRASDGRIFYVGKGVEQRLLTATGRNKYWHRVAKKHGWTAHKIFSELTEACAHSIEKMLIHANRSALTNITSGGEGVSGYKHSDETKRKMVKNRKPCPGFWTGKTMPDEMKAKFRAAKLGKSQSPEHAAKSRANKIGKKQPASAIEHLRLRKSKSIINSEGEIFPSASEAARIMSIRTGRSCSQSNISMCANGQRANAYGFSWSYDTGATPSFCPSKSSEKPIICIETGTMFSSVGKALEWVASRRGAAVHQMISAAARGDCKTAYGFSWAYSLAA